MKPTPPPGSSFSYICLAIYFSFAFVFRSIKPKIQKYFAALYFICDLLFQSIITFLPSHAISGAVTRKGLTTPLTRRVARCCCLFAGVVYVVLLGSPTGSLPWFHNRGKSLPPLCYIIPPPPGKYRRSPSCHQGEFLAPLSGWIFNITRFLIANIISLKFTLFSICLSFSSPPLHKNLPFYSPLFSVCRFLAGSVFECNLVVWSP